MKTAKKIIMTAVIAVLLASVAAVAIVVVLNAKKELPPDAGAHVHVYDKKVEADEYLVHAATCETDAEYYYSCECGESVGPHISEIKNMSSSSNKTPSGGYTVFKGTSAAAKHYGHTPVTDNAVDPTCTLPGKTEGSHCSTCGKVLEKQTEILATGHNVTSWTVTSEPTCTVSGSRTGDCSVCGVAVTETISALGHDYEYREAQAATCTEIGWNAYAVCKRDGCGYTTYKEIKAKGHKPVTDERVEPTCTETGLTEGSHCETCGLVLTAQTVIPTSGHAFQEKWSFNANAHWHAAACKHTSETSDYSEHTVVTDEKVEPTCTAKGLTEGSHCSVCGYVIVKQESIARLEHEYTVEKYEWSADNSTCTATLKCTRDGCDEVYTENGSVRRSIIQKQSCTEEEIITFNASFSNGACETQVKEKVTTAPALGHNYSEASYLWGPDNKTCTARRVCTRCKYTEEETAESASRVIREKACELDELSEFTATFTNSAFETQIKEDVTAKMTGHTYANLTYTWNDDHTSCTATYTCAHDSSHIETETTEAITGIITQNAACEKPQLTTYTATFTKPWFGTTTEISETASALGHDWGKATYLWTGTEACTATRVCNNDNDHVQKANATISADENTYKATCVTTGKIVYTATFSESWAGSDKKETVTAIDKVNGHDWGEATYVWTGITACTATRVCNNDGSHKETENAVITSEITQKQSCELAEKTTYTAAFSNTAFAAQRQEEVTQKALGHDYGTASYRWESDYSACTATHTCTRSGCGHVEDEKVTADKAITQEQSCELDQLTTFTATFTKEGFDLQTASDVHTKPASGHTWGTATEENVVDATCTQDGSYDSVVKCKTCGKELSRTEKTIAALGHSYDETVWMTSDDEHWHVCSRCKEEVENAAHTYVSGESNLCTVCGAANVTDFTFTLNSDGESYTLTKYTGAGGKVVTPTTYKGKPVTAIGSFAFVGQNGLNELPAKKITEVIISKGIKSIGEYQFQGCTQLKRVVIPEGCTTIMGENMFYNCGNALEEITIPVSLTSINYGSKTYLNAFNYSGLALKINYAGTMAQWKAIKNTTAFLKTQFVNEPYLTKARIHCTDGILNCYGNQVEE